MTRNIHTETCPHCHKTKHHAYLAAHANSCVYNPTIAAELKRYIRQNSPDGHGMPLPRYRVERPGHLPSARAITDQFNGWENFLMDFCNVDPPRRGVPQCRYSFLSRCECGRRARHFDVALSVAGGFAMYNLCDSCYALEMEPVQTRGELLVNR